MAFVVIDKERCKGCALCIGACPKNVLKTSVDSNKSGYFPALPVELSQCIGCARCAYMCPDCCITVEK